MHTTLDQLEKHIKHKKSLKHPKNLLKEFKTILVFFLITFVWILLFTNAKIFFSFWTGDQEIVNRDQDNIKQNSTISNNIQADQIKKQELEKIIESYQKEEIFVEKNVSVDLDQYMNDKLKSYNFEFNTLPPTNRLIIPKISLDVPLIDSKYKDEDDFSQWNFDEELQNGVVKYPTTPIPGLEWNTLLFGHTSQEWREHNPYGTVFYNIPDLENGDTITLIREWKLYDYKILEKTIVRPSKVDKQYQKYQNKWEDYLTIMGCYPLGRTDKRMMITAKRIK